MQRETFGRYLRQKRMEKQKTTRALCEALGLSAPYMCDIENDRRNPPERAKLEQMMNFLQLSPQERQRMYDLAGEARDAVAPDLTDYIMEGRAVRVALRAARDAELSEEEWLSFARQILQRGTEE